MARTPVRPVVRRLGGADLHAAADLLVRAFDDDPVANFVFAGDRRRARGLHSFFTTQLRRQYLPYGEVYTTADLRGVAIWGPPERPRAGLRDLFQLLPTAPFLVGPRMVRVMRLLVDVDERHPKEPHWYLATLGTDPEFQGTGVGSALMTSVLARVDEAGMPAYLESSKARNVPFYVRHGFEVMEEFRTAGSPPIWQMWREPRVPEA